MSNVCAVTVSIIDQEGGKNVPWTDMYVVEFEGVEGVSQLFEFRIKLYYNGEQLPKNVLGKPVTLLLEHSDAYIRPINGIINTFEYERTINDRAGKSVHVYWATLVPRAWKLLHRSDCRVFYRKSVREILGEVLSDSGMMAAGDYDLAFFDGGQNGELKWPGGPRDEEGFRTQYRESDWTFLCRMMEEFGIFYYFDHSPEKHVLKLGNAAAHYGPCNPGSLIYGDAVDGAPFRLFPFRFREAIRPEQVTLKDFNESRPRAPLEKALRTDATSVDGHLELYDYPGGFAEDVQKNGMTKVRLQEARVLAGQASGDSDCIGLVPGNWFSLTGTSENPDLSQDYVLLQVYHSASNNDPDARYQDRSLQYHNSFRCMPKSVPFRAPRVTPRPSVRGIETAMVQGPTPGEPYIDGSGRVKIKYHWQKQSDYPWVRVAQTIAMRLDADPVRGAMYWPRVGDEVVVDFVDGDPDRPLIVGSVYTTIPQAGLKYAPHGPIDTPTLTVHKKGHDDQTKIWTDPSATTSPPVKTMSKPGGPNKLNSDGLNKDWPPYVMSSQDLTLSNPHRNVIKDGANEISLHDDGSTHALLVQARHGKKDAHLKTDADFHHANADKYYQVVNEEYRLQVKSAAGAASKGGKKQDIDGPYHLYCSGDHRVEVGGNVISYIGGNTYLTNDQKTYNWGKTEDYQYDDTYSEVIANSTSYQLGADTGTLIGASTSVQVGASTSVQTGMDSSLQIGVGNSITLGMQNSLNIGGVFEGNISGGITIDIGVLKFTLELSLLTAKINGSALCIERDLSLRLSLFPLRLKKTDVDLHSEQIKVMQENIRMYKRDLEAEQGNINLLLNNANIFS